MIASLNWVFNERLNSVAQIATHLLALAGLGILVLSCRRDQDVQPQNADFSVVYRFVNQSPDPLRALNLAVAAYFPKTGRTSAFYKHFPDSATGDTTRIVIDTTTATRTFGYVSYFQQMEVDVRPYVTPRLVHVSVWLMKPGWIAATKRTCTLTAQEKDWINSFVNNQQRQT